MALGEFALINRYFATRGVRRDDVALGIGDDCALLRLPAGQVLAVTMDTMVEGVHFLPGATPVDLGHKLLAVNLSDLAAMGAEPAWATLALTLPQSDSEWLEAFSTGLFELAARHRVQLVGGDTTRGPLTLTLQAHGFVPGEQALRRSGARVGDVIYVTGTLGDAALGLQVAEGRIALAADHAQYALARLHRPEPRVAAGIALRGLASSAIDISDGLVADLGHILAASGVGAAVDVGCLPLSTALRALGHEMTAVDLALCGGDDYELCFTASPAYRAEINAIFSHLDCSLGEIGVITTGPALRCVWRGADYTPRGSGYQHFSTSSVDNAI